MKLRTFLLAGVSALLGLGLILGVVDLRAQGKEPSGKAALELHLSLRLDESGEPKLYIDMPASEEFLRLLLNGQEKHPAVFLAATKDIPYGEVVKVIDMLGSLGLHTISLDAKHSSKP
jgi:biopolymer transport protein ExbD